MCLYSLDKDVRKFLHENRGNVFIPVYKFVRVQIDNMTGEIKLMPPYKGNMSYTNKMIQKKLTRRKFDCSVREGIHVYLSKKSATRQAGDGYTWIRLHAEVDSVLGVNANSNHAVFANVFFTKKEYDAAIKRAKEKCSSQS